MHTIVTDTSKGNGTLRNVSES